MADKTKGVWPPGRLESTLEANARVRVAKGGNSVGVRRTINFIEGESVVLTVADNSGNERVDVTIAASGAISESLTTTKGDLIVDDGADPQRLPVGDPCEVLTADPSAALGVSWQASYARSLLLMGG